MSSPVEQPICVVCGGAMQAPTQSGCCSGRCRAAKSRHQADARRQHDLTEIMAQLDGLRLRVAILRDGESGGVA